MKACADVSCSSTAATYTDTTASTSEEYWQIQGTGNDYTTADQIVTGGITAPYVIRYGASAGASLDGKVRIYFNPNLFQLPGVTGGMIVGGTTVTATSTLNTVATFTADTDLGLRNPSAAATLVKRLLTYQGIPLASSSKIRVFFEADGAAGKTRLLYIDSQDGFVGQDFHSGAAKLVENQVDWDTGGVAEPTPAIGINTDVVAGSTGLDHARQSKIGYPVLDGWTWDESVGTFMVITGQDTAGQTENGLFYATWDGTTWNVVKDGSGDADPLVIGAHGPVIVHLGGEKYKLYYEDEAASPGNKKEKPPRMIYADGSSTGTSTIVDFADWEASSKSRDVHFLWPDNSVMNADDESGLGDHVIFHPNSDLTTQVMYMDLGGKDHSADVASKGIGMADLINP